MSGIVFAIFVAVLPRNISALNKAQDLRRDCGTLLGLWHRVSQLGLDLTETLVIMGDDHDHV